MRILTSTTRTRVDPEAQLDAAEKESQRKDQELSNALKERKALKRELAQRDEVMQQMKVENAMKTGMITELQTKLWETDSALSVAQENLQNASAAMNDQQQVISQWQVHSQVFLKEHEKTKSLLNTRTRELKAAEKFLTKHDTSTNKEVVEKTEGLNYDVAQIAMGLADSILGEAQLLEEEKIERLRQDVRWKKDDEDGLPEERGSETTPTAKEVEVDSEDEIAQALQDMRSWFGTTATEALQRTRHTDDSLLLEIFLQSCLTQFAADVIVQWHFGRDYADAQAFRIIFCSLEEAGESPNCNRHLEGIYSSVTLLQSPQRYLVSGRSLRGATLDLLLHTMLARQRNSPCRLSTTLRRFSLRQELSSLGCL